MPKQLALANRQLFPESSILCTQERVSTMQWMLRGGVWRGEDGQVHSLGGKLRSLKDARPGREHLPFPFIDQLTSFWQIHTKETEEQSLGNGPWEVAQRTWHQWSSGRRSGKLDTSVPSAPELKVLGEALSRDFKDLKVDLEACSFEHPTGFISGFGGRQRRLRTGDHVSIGYDTGELGYMRIAKAVTVVLDDKRRIHYIFPYWYRETGQDAATGRPLLKPAGSNRSQYNIPVLLGSVREQVLVVHKCLRTCAKRAAADHDPSSCAHRCVLQKSCPAHSDSKCTQPACLRDPWVDVLHHCDGSAWLVFDYAAGFVVDSVPLSLDETEVSASAE